MRPEVQWYYDRDENCWVIAVFANDVRIGPEHLADSYRDKLAIMRELEIEIDQRESEWKETVK